MPGSAEVAVATDHQAGVDGLLAEYRRSREQLAAVHRELASIAESASDADGLITVTVSARGSIIGLQLAEGAYRVYRPDQLARQIVLVAGMATTKAVRAAGRALEPVLPADSDPDALLRGTADLRPDEYAPVTATEEEESMEERSWLQTERRP
jgi:YbaB/EbfC DNA-binding family protein